LTVKATKRKALKKKHLSRGGLAATQPARRKRGDGIVLDERAQEQPADRRVAQHTTKGRPR
jgi:hypothetical protein